MKVDRATLEKNLPKKGFRRVNDGDHVYFHHEINGRRTGAYTFVSHSKKHRDIDKAILAATRVQLKLDKNTQVLDLVNCPMDADEYNRLLREKAVIT